MISGRIQEGNCFELLNDKVAAGIGMVAKNSGKRPSELFEWNDPQEWDARLAFDLRVTEVLTRAMAGDNNDE